MVFMPNVALVAVRIMVEASQVKLPLRVREPAAPVRKLKRKTKSLEE